MNRGPRHEETLERLENCPKNDTVKGTVPPSANQALNATGNSLSSDRNCYKQNKQEKHIGKDQLNPNYNRFYKVTSINNDGTVDFVTKYRKYTVNQPPIPYAYNPHYQEYRKPFSNKKQYRKFRSDENFRVIKPKQEPMRQSFTPPGTPPCTPPNTHPRYFNNFQNSFKRKTISEDRDIKRYKCPDGPRTPPMSYRRSNSPVTLCELQQLPVIETYRDYKRQKRVQLEQNQEQSHIWSERFVELRNGLQRTPPVFKTSTLDSPFSDGSEILSASSKPTTSSAASSSSTLTSKSSQQSPIIIASSFLPEIPRKTEIEENAQRKQSYPDEQRKQERKRCKVQRQIVRDKRKGILRQEIQTFVDAGICEDDTELISKLLKLNFNLPRSTSYSKFVIKKRTIVEETEPDSTLDVSTLPPPPPPSSPLMFRF